VVCVSVVCRGAQATEEASERERENERERERERERESGTCSLP